MKVKFSFGLKLFSFFLSYLDLGSVSDYYYWNAYQGPPLSLQDAVCGVSETAESRPTRREQDAVRLQVPAHIDNRSLYF
jgi:hypothetical protein